MDNEVTGNRMTKELLTAEQVASFLNVSIKTIRNWTSAEILPCFRMNRNLVRYRQSEIESWLAQYHQKGRATRKLPVSGD